MNYDYKTYWEERARSTITNDDFKLGAICYFDMPKWFNAFFDYFQKKAFLDLVKIVGNVKRKEILEIGCGTGRFSKLVADNDIDVYGIDISGEMLKYAKRNVLNGIFVRMSATTLHFQNSTFDLVLSATVLQHLPYCDQEKAIKEICRVTKKNGYIIILELCDLEDRAKHVFPRTKEDWIMSFQKNGCNYINSKNVEYVPLLKFSKILVSKILNRSEKKKDLTDKGIPSGFSRNVLKHIYYFSLRISIYFSYPIEEFLYHLNLNKARHCAIIFRKSN